MPIRFTLFTKAATSARKKPQHTATLSGASHVSIPKLSLSLNMIRAEASKVDKYARVCDFYIDGKTLPLSYPHILTFNLQLQLMLDKRFPFPIIGLIHIRNSIIAHRKILINESLDLHVAMGDSRITTKGIEFDIHSKVATKGAIVWESITTNLYLHKSDVKQTNRHLDNKRQHKHQPSFRYHQRWHLGENLGRKYALVSGDVNPIHLHSLTAKAFGFKQAITHGMWLKARTIAALMPIINHHTAVMISVAFKQPTPLNSMVKMNYQARRSKPKKNENQVGQNTGIDFDIRSLNGENLHMVGAITYPNKK